MKKDKKLCIKTGWLLFCFIYMNAIIGQTTIPANFFGQNAWMPDSLGNTKKGGKLDSNWANIKASNVAYIRIGGTGPNNLKYTDHQLIELIDSIKGRGMEPIVQVPYHITSPTYDSATARALVLLVNQTYARNVRYWSIGNEPNQSNYKALRISDYIKRISFAMKNQDNTIKVIGPELSYLPGDPNDTFRKVTDSLTHPTNGGSIMGKIPSGNASGKVYVDYFSYHMYNFEGTSTTPTRASLIDQLTTTNKDSSAMGYIKRKCDTVNADATLNRGAQPIYPVMTEANICWYADTLSNDPVNGVKANSFFAGQHISELASLAIYKNLKWINYWSFVEGYNSGFLTNKGINPTKKSTYHHLTKLGQWIKGTLYLATDDSAGGGTNIKHIKAFAAKTSSYIAVMVMNQAADENAKNYYNLLLNNSASGTKLRINLNMGISASHTDSLYGSSTTLLIFNCAGSLAYKYRYEQRDINNPFKSVSFSSPATIFTISAGADQTICCAECTTNYTVTNSSRASGFTYQWYINGVAQGGPVTTNTFAATGPLPSTTYTITVVATYTPTGCTAQDDALLNIQDGPNCSSPRLMSVQNLETSTIDVSLIQSLVPNPAQNKVSIYYLLQPNIKNAEIAVINYNGQTVAKYPVTSEKTVLDVDCTNFPPGVYICSLNINQQSVNNKKLVITK